MAEQKKVFCISAHKNATTSLGVALNNLGYRMCPIEKGYKYLEPTEENRDAALHLTDEYDAFEDCPWSDGNLYEKLYEKHPHAHFILTTRASNEWAESYFRFIALFGGWDYFPVKEHFVRLYGAPGIPENKPIMIKNYELRNQQIREFFKMRPEANFLELTITNLSYAVICEFLSIHEIPRESFPFLNVTRKESKQIND